MNMKCKILFVAVTLGFAACGQDELPPVSKSGDVKMPVVAKAEVKKKETEAYVYRGDRMRDPFIALNGETLRTTTSDEVVVPKLGALMLKGVFDDGKQMVAVISSGGISYILKGSKLYDNRQRLVAGITGIIKKESVIMIAPDKTTKELRLREK